MIDTHVHLQDKVYNRDIREIMQRAAQAGIESMVVVGYDYNSSEAAVTLCAQYAHLRAAVGVHPHDARNWSVPTAQQLKIIAVNKKVVAIGEIGLDYFRNLSSKEQQQTVFTEQLRLALELDLPVIIHSREAADDVLGVLKNYPLTRGVIHCYSGTVAQAEKFMALGYYLGICGNVTYPQAQLLKEVARTIPLERLLLETDAPYLAPQGQRGKRNEPALLVHSAEEIARLKGMAVATIARQTTENAKKLFRI